MGDRGTPDSDVETGGAEGYIHDLLFFDRKPRKSCRVFSDASNELAYTVYIDIISGLFAFGLVMRWQVTYTSRS
jgi:hypothetical protein